MHASQKICPQMVEVSLTNLPKQTAQEITWSCFGATTGLDAHSGNGDSDFLCAHHSTYFYQFIDACKISKTKITISKLKQK